MSNRREGRTCGCPSVCAPPCPALPCPYLEQQGLEFLHANDAVVAHGKQALQHGHDRLQVVDLVNYLLVLALCEETNRGRCSALGCENKNCNRKSSQAPAAALAAVWTHLKELKGDLIHVDLVGEVHKVLEALFSQKLVDNLVCLGADGLAEAGHLGVRRVCVEVRQASSSERGLVSLSSFNISLYVLQDGDFAAELRARPSRAVHPSAALLQVSK